ncbi:MAG: GNAT family N-acetyltransferase [Pyrinomonadaceae bacterium]|nr:GNAT family N-acetyltransferase [Phycisphaerales bacterium]
MLPIRTQRLLLRPFESGDAPALAAYRSDPEVARYQSWTAPYSLESAQKLIQPLLSRRLAPPAPGEWNQIAIELLTSISSTPGDPRRSDGAIIGDCVFRVDPQDIRQASVGYTLARLHQHHGYATEAVLGLLGALFDGLNLHRVTAMCDAENGPSQRLLERIGMRREAHFVQNVFFKGAWGSEFAYAMLKSEWTGRDARAQG